MSGRRARVRTTLALLLSAALRLTWVATASASDLSWSGPSDCAQSEQLLFQVERALDAPLAITGDVHLQVHVARTVPNVHALLRIEDAATSPALSERSLVAPSCEKLVDTLAVAITLALEASAPARQPEPAAAGLPAAMPPGALVAAELAPPPAADVVTHEPEVAAPGPALGVVARVRGDVGSLPSPAFGLGLGAQLGWSRLHFELLGTVWSEQHTRLDVSGVPSAGADITLVTGTLSACTTPLGTDAPLEFVACLGWEMGRLSGIGTGIRAPRSASGLWLAPGLEAGLTWRATRAVGLGAQLGAATPLQRGEFYLERLGTVHQPANVVARAGLSVEIAFE